MRAPNNWPLPPPLSLYRRLMAENDAKHRASLATIRTALIDGATLIKHTLDVIEARRR